jgi:cytochrome c553
MRTHLVAGLLWTVALLPAAARAQTVAPPAEAYAWAEACKACHGEIYDAWSKTKHAKTIVRLSADDKAKECIGCHVTGPKQAVMSGDKMVNADVQCESCHGPGKAHIEGAAAGTPKTPGLVRSPDQRLCETCHNDKSPHYRGFFYSALKGLVHKTK